MIKRFVANIVPQHETVENRSCPVSVISRRYVPGNGNIIVQRIV